MLWLAKVSSLLVKNGASQTQVTVQSHASNSHFHPQMLIIQSQVTNEICRKLQFLTIAIQSSLQSECLSCELLLVCCFPQPLEPLEAEKVSCGANVLPPITFQSLNCWPWCFGNQPSQAQRERAAARNVRISLRMCS